MEAFFLAIIAYKQWVSYGCWQVALVTGNEHIWYMALSMCYQKRDGRVPLLQHLWVGGVGGEQQFAAVVRRLYAGALYSASPLRWLQKCVPIFGVAEQVRRLLCLRDLRANHACHNRAYAAVE